MFLNFDQISFCLEVCKLDPVFSSDAFLGMLKGLVYLEQALPPALFVVGMIVDLGELIDPVANRTGFRMLDSIADGVQVGMPPDSIVASLERLCLAAVDMHPSEWFERFMEIHPLLNGNFHVGVLIWNFLRDNLATPDLPPIPHIAI